MIALETVLQQSEVYYDFLADRRCGCLFSEPESASNLDLYAHYWLGMILINKSQVAVGFQLVDEASEQVGTVIHRHNPHFLTWVYFIVCYPGPGVETVGSRMLRYTEALVQLRSSSNYPRRIILEHLSSNSDTSKHLALTLLRRTINVFRQKTRDSHLEELQVLSMFFEYINSNEDFDDHKIEGL